MSSTPQESNVEPLSKAVIKLIDEEFYDSYTGQLVKLSDSAGLAKIAPYKHLMIDLYSLLNGSDDAKQREVEKLAELSRHIKNPELMKIAKRFQGLLALHDEIDYNFGQLCDRCSASSTDPVATAAFERTAAAYFAPRIRQIIMPETIKARPQASEMVADIERREALSETLYKLAPATSTTLRSAFSDQRFQDLEKGFEDMVRNISGLGAARVKQR